MDDSPEGVRHTADGHEGRDRGKRQPPQVPPTTHASHVHILPGPRAAAHRAADMARRAPSQCLCRRRLSYLAQPRKSSPQLPEPLRRRATDAPSQWTDRLTHDLRLR
jgi:hypothetical protein